MQYQEMASPERNTPQYTASFGKQWLRYRQTQLDSFTGVPLSRDRVQRCLGEVWDKLAGASVLEAGCGAGRFTEVLLEQGATITSVDMSEAVFANRQNCPLSERHTIVQ